MDFERREICFEGRVQGVGFRYQTNQIASRFAVTGWVKNLPNGHVKLVVEGRRAEIEAFLNAVHTAMSQNIDDSLTTSVPYVGQFEGFEIRT